MIGAQLSAYYDGPVCVGTQLVFTCQQPGGLSRWDVTLSASRKISQSVLYTRIGIVHYFIDDPGFGFEVYILNSSSSSSLVLSLNYV